MTVTKQRLSYGGRQFKVGDEISVENAEYGKIEDAKIESLQEAMVVIRGTASWDTRQVNLKVFFFFFLNLSFYYLEHVIRKKRVRGGIVNDRLIRRIVLSWSREHFNTIPLWETRSLQIMCPREE